LTWATALSGSERQERKLERIRGHATLKPVRRGTGSEHCCQHSDSAPIRVAFTSPASTTRSLFRRSDQQRQQYASRHAGGRRPYRPKKQVSYAIRCETLRESAKEARLPDQSR